MVANAMKADLRVTLCILYTVVVHNSETLERRS